MDTPYQENLIILETETDVRLDKWLALKFPTYSRTYFQYLIEQGCVLLNGEIVKKRVCPLEGDEIEVCFQALPGSSLTPESIPLNILYEDEYLLAVNKMPGMVVHPAPGNWSGTFVNALLGYCETLAPGTDPLRPGIVHRLDKNTSGVLLAAKTPLAHQRLIASFASRQIEKLYLAICVGRPPNGLISAPIGRHPVHRKKMAVLPNGKEAISDVQTIAFNDQVSLVLIRPKTGRTHQIRVHLEHLGCHIVGEDLYSTVKTTHRLLLHAYRLGFTHPITGASLHLSAPIPEDFKAWIRHLGACSSCHIKSPL